VIFWVVLTLRDRNAWISRQLHDCKRICPCFAKSCHVRMPQRVDNKIGKEQLADASPSPTAPSLNFSDDLVSFDRMNDVTYSLCRNGEEASFCHF